MILTAKQRKLLNKLIDKYESSATFRGNNKVNQSFKVEINNVFEKYSDDREYDLFVEVNQDVGQLQESGYVTVEMNGVLIDKILLCTDKLQDIYEVLNRQSKRDIMIALENVLNKEKAFLEESKEIGNYELADVLIKYIDEQYDRIKKGKLPQYYDDSIIDYSDMWLALEWLLSFDGEIYIRDLSIRLYKDSKRLEALSGKISSLLYNYGEYPIQDKILEEIGIIKTPSYVMVQGSISITLKEEHIDVGKLSGDIAFSTKTLKDIIGINVYGNRVITVENLTTFHSYSFSEDAVVIYLGGYHNKVKRDFLKMIYENASDIDYFHFGDIDAGGFYIYEHLRKMTKIPFKTMNMDVDMLEQHLNFAKTLTANDIKRLKILLAKYKSGEFDNPNSDDIIVILEYMINNNIKLEQEAL